MALGAQPGLVLSPVWQEQQDRFAIDSHGEPPLGPRSSQKYPCFIPCFEIQQKNWAAKTRDPQAEGQQVGRLELVAPRALWNERPSCAAFHACSGPNCRIRSAESMTG